jgi:hypothetical protein
MRTKISRWEKFKRMVAHAFDLKTKGEIREHFERLEWEREQAQLKLQHKQHVRSLLIEYHDQIEEYEKEQEQRRIQEEQERKRQELIQLYKDNRKRQSDIYYRETTQPEDTVVEDTVETE